MDIIPNNTFTMTPDGKLVPVGEVTGTVDDYAGKPQGTEQTPAWKDNNYADNPAGKPQGTVVSAGSPYGVDANGNKTNNPSGVATNEQGTTDNIGEKPQGTVSKESYWDNGFTKDAVKKSGLTIGEAMINYNEWAKENGQEPLDFGTVWTMFNGKDPDKSVVDNEKAAKKAYDQEKFEKVGNFLSHLGNFIGTLQGAPSQQLESGAELSKRQRELRDRTLAQRKSDWQDIYTAYKQKKADELAAKNAEAKQQALELKEREVEAKIQKMKDDTNLAQFKAEADRDFKNASIELRYKVLEVQQALAEKRITIAEANSKLNTLRADLQKEANELKKQGETTEYERDRKGRVVKSVKTHHGQSQQQSSNTNHDETNTPPSMRGKN